MSTRKSKDQGKPLVPHGIERVQKQPELESAVTSGLASEENLFGHQRMTPYCKLSGSVSFIQGQEVHSYHYAREPKPRKSNAKTNSNAQGYL